MDNKDEIRVWGIHTSDDDLFLKNNVLAIGWEEIGDLEKIEKTREGFKKKYAKVYPGASKGSISTNVGQLYRFVCEMQVGDYVIFPSKSDRKINIGIIESNSFFAADETKYTHRRKVKWIKHFPRTFFSQGALYEVGSALTLFSVKNYADEFISFINGKISLYVMAF